MKRGGRNEEGREGRKKEGKKEGGKEGRKERKKEGKKEGRKLQCEPCHVKLKEVFPSQL